MAGDISFNLTNPATANRIRMVTTDPDTGPVERSSLVKGYAIEKNNYVLFSDEDFQSVKLETTKTLEIERFVDADTIDRLDWDIPYVLVPLEVLRKPTRLSSRLWFRKTKSRRGGWSCTPASA